MEDTSSFYSAVKCFSWNQVGPIPVEDGIGKEVAAQITTNMETNKTFYTDSNGRDFIKRVYFLVFVAAPTAYIFAWMCTNKIV